MIILCMHCGRQLGAHERCSCRAPNICTCAGCQVERRIERTLVTARALAPAIRFEEPRAAITLPHRIGMAQIDPETLMPLCAACPLKADEKVDGEWLCARCGREARRQR